MSLHWHGELAWLEAPLGRPATCFADARLPALHLPSPCSDAPPVAISTGSTSSSSTVSVSKVVILVAVFVGAASAFVGLVTYWLMRERCGCLGLLTGGSGGR